jgi:hypothetical protein
MGYESSISTDNNQVIFYASTPILAWNVRFTNCAFCLVFLCKPIELLGVKEINYAFCLVFLCKPIKLLGVKEITVLPSLEGVGTLEL